MTRLIALWLLFFSNQIIAQSPNTDWLIKPIIQRSEVKISNKTLELNNGLIARRIHISPNAATTSFKNVVTGEQFIRSVRPEARIILDGKTYNVGGLYGQKEHAYLLDDWIPNFKNNEADFQYQRYEIGEVQPHFSWNCQTWASNRKLPTGKHLKLFFASNTEEVKNVEVVVHYEIFDGIPVLNK